MQLKQINKLQSKTDVDLKLSSIFPNFYLCFYPIASWLYCYWKTGQRAESIANGLNDQKYSLVKNLKRNTSELMQNELTTVQH